MYSSKSIGRVEIGTRSFLRGGDIPLRDRDCVMLFVGIVLVLDKDSTRVLYVNCRINCYFIVFNSGKLIVV